MPAPSPQWFWSRLTNPVLIRFLLLFAASWALLQVFAYFQSIVLIVIFAAILAFLLNYPTRWLRRFLPHPVAATIVFLVALILLFALLVTIGFAVLSQGPALVNRITEFLDLMDDLSQKVEVLSRTRGYQIDIGAVEEKIRDQVIESIGSGVGFVQGALSNLLDLILIAVVSFFLLLDRGRVWDFLLQGLSQQNRDRVTDAIKTNFLGFFWARFLLALFFAVSSFLVFLQLEVPVPLILALMAGAFNMIPGIGATMGISLICLILLPQGWEKAAQVLAGCILLQQIEENILMPRIMQNSLKMSPVILFLALLVGARLAGLVGLFLSIPTAGVILSLVDSNSEPSNRTVVIPDSPPTP